MEDRPDIEAVLLHYGADRVPERRGTGWRAMSCPFHEDGHASASVSQDAFTCHACGVKGDAFSIIQQQENCTFPEALALAQQIDTDYTPDSPTKPGRRAGKRKTGRRWSPPGRRGRQPWT